MGEQAEQDCVCMRVSFGWGLWEPMFRPLWCLHSSLLLLLERKSASPFLTLADFTASFPPLALPFLSLSHFFSTGFSSPPNSCCIPLCHIWREFVLVLSLSVSLSYFPAPVSHQQESLRSKWKIRQRIIYLFCKLTRFNELLIKINQ